LSGLTRPGLACMQGWRVSPSHLRLWRPIVKAVRLAPQAGHFGMPPLYTWCPDIQRKSKVFVVFGRSVARCAIKG
jgi:hypothetical protein